MNSNSNEQKIQIPTPRIRLKDIRKCPAQSNPYHLPYEKRLERPSLRDLKKRRERGYFTQISKIVHGLEKVNCCDENKILSKLVEQNNTSRRHSLQLSRERTSGNEPRTHFRLDRMASPWNNSPKNIALAHSVNSFKSELDILVTAVFPYYNY